MSNFTSFPNAADIASALEAGVIPAIQHAGKQAEDLLERGSAAWCHQRDAVRDRVTHLQGQANDYVQRQPVQSLLLAAAAGVLVAGLVGWYVRAPRHHSR